MYRFILFNSDFKDVQIIEMLQTIYNTEQVKGYSDGDLDRFFDGRDEWISIAIDDDKIIAFLSIEVHHEDEEYIYLDDLSVTLEYEIYADQGRRYLMVKYI